RLQEALAEHDGARKHFAMLEDDFPRVPKYALELANTENSRFFVLRQMKDLDGAQQALERARKLLEKWVEPNAPPAWHADLGRTCGNLGLVLYLQNQREKARDHFQQAIRHLEKAREKNRTNPDYLTALRENYRNLAETCLELRDPGQAAQAARSLAGVSSGQSLETYFAACFMARSAAADNQDHAERVRLALEYLNSALRSGFDDGARFREDQNREYFVALEREEKFRGICEKLKPKAGRALSSPPPKR